MVSIYRNKLLHPKKQSTFVQRGCAHIYVSVCVGTCVFIYTHPHVDTQHMHTHSWLNSRATAEKSESWGWKKNLRLQYNICFTIYDYTQVYLKSLFRSEVFMSEAKKSEQTPEPAHMHHLNPKLWTQGTQFCNSCSGKALTEVTPLTSKVVSSKYYKV